MVVDWKFLKWVAVAIIAVWGIAAYPLMSVGDERAFIGAVIGTVLSAANAVVGAMTVEYAFDKSQGTFIKAVLGGMALRMMLMLALFFVLIKFFEIHTIALTVFLLGFYMIFLAMEVLSIHTKAESKEAGSALR